MSRNLRRRIERIKRLDARAEARKNLKLAEVLKDCTENTVTEKLRDPLGWLQKHTKTKDPHWREVGAASPYSPFPDKPYFRPILEVYQREPIVFVVKSRDMMISWLSVAYLTHACMTTPGIEVLMQSQTEDKASELVDYAKILWDQSDDDIKVFCPLTRPMEKQSWLELNFANGSRIIGIPHGSSTIRSYHPWALFIDEAAFVPDAGDSYNEAISACKKILVVSSANVGWFESVVESGE